MEQDERTNHGSTRIFWELPSRSISAIHVFIHQTIATNFITVTASIFIPSTTSTTAIILVFLLVNLIALSFSLTAPPVVPFLLPPSTFHERLHRRPRRRGQPAQTPPAAAMEFKQSRGWRDSGLPLRLRRWGDRRLLPSARRWELGIPRRATSGAFFDQSVSERFLRDFSSLVDDYY